MICVYIYIINFLNRYIYIYMYITPPPVMCVGL